MDVVDEILSHFITHSFLDPNDDRVLETILNQPIPGTPLKMRDLTDPKTLREKLLSVQEKLLPQEPEEFVVQPQDERVTLQKRLSEREKSVANRLLADLGISRNGRNLSKFSQDVRGKSNHQAAIILMILAVNEYMNIPEGKRKDVPAEKLQNTFDQLDSIGDELAKKIRSTLDQTKRKKR